MMFNIGDIVIYKGSIEYVVSEIQGGSTGYLNTIDNIRLPQNLVVDDCDIKLSSDMKVNRRNDNIDKLLSDV